ncbi:hypothetical protein ABT354_14070 [Streptomyces sp. NPDC000594]|uniref:hypothetical protein n=1 Tax=Streptomyces sp. NPDC000594 TaxID=3154261 RepID=UPI0033195B3E
MAEQRAGLGSEETVLLMAGAVDMVLEQAEGALRRARSLLSRSDLTELAADARRDLVARGRHSGLRTSLVTPGEPHLEQLARRAAERAARSARAAPSARPAGAPPGPGGAGGPDPAGSGASGR